MYLKSKFHNYCLTIRKQAIDILKDFEFNKYSNKKSYRKNSGYLYKLFKDYTIKIDKQEDARKNAVDR